jgi:hypothetical protein
MLEATTLGISIDRDWRDVYDTIWRPQAFPKWASGLANQTFEKRDGYWAADGPAGSVKIRFTDQNPFGVMDHYVELGDGNEIYIPLRVFQNGKGAEVALTLFRQPDMTIDKFEADVAWVRRDLESLKALFMP